ncbi:hypothetical protein GCG21_11365 [Pseudactinotalea sp. HY160]|uniref:hypothetical protein n=1 Tax=Pseudactinotalea sp. HY160 TaxID=2654490 RepID=UPI00128E001A|nr:hypothetical protein [Pseudactinotalea sp. HY160]MPV50592.1 hypothetical protein [Pseudactinotalea sp. HY160]
MSSTLTPPAWLPEPGTFTTPAERRDALFASRLAARRRRLLLWSAPLVLLALLASAKLLSATLINMAGSSAYSSASYATAQDRYEDLKFFNVIEPWKAYFNEGTARYAAGEFFLATQQFDPALDLVPRAPEGEPREPLECAVRTNYSLSLEGLGDESLAANDPGMATNYYDQAQEMLADCGTSGGGGEAAEQAEERQQQRQEEAQNQQEQQQGGDPDSPENPANPDSPANPSDSPSAGDPTPGEESPTPGDEGGDPSESPSEGESGGQDPSPTPSEGGPGEGTPSAEPSGRPTDPKEQELQDRNDEANETGEQETGSGLGSGQNW